MSSSERNSWLLPEGIEDVLPDRAAQLEQVRRRLLDHFSGWGYEYVITPMLEFLDSLLTGTGRDLDIKTFKVTDQMSGRTMGVRADMTPQAARIDAHSLNRDGPVRLCYAGTVLHSRPDNMLASRSPTMAGAELFGVRDASADLEIICLMVDALQALGVDRIHLELGDVSIFRELVTGVSEADQAEIFDLIQRKAHADLAAAVERSVADPVLRELIIELPRLCGGSEVLFRAQEMFAGNDTICASIRNLEWISERVADRFSGIDFYYDLSELRGYSYHTGIVFAAFVDGTRVAKGGRYDDVGAVFGRNRGATGFDVHVASLASLLRALVPEHSQVLVRATDTINDDCWRAVQALRSEGVTVIETLDDSAAGAARLSFVDGEWQVVQQ